MGPTCCEPPAAFLLPLQYEFPLAVHDVGLPVVLQVTVALEPVVILDGLTEIFTVGTADTVNVAVFDPLPAALEHVKVYVKLPAVFLTPVLVEPFALGFVTQVPADPLAEHDVGLFVALHVIVALLPVPMELGEIDIDTTGGDVAFPDVTFRLADALPVPPAFMQVRVKL